MAIAIQVKFVVKYMPQLCAFSATRSAHSARTDAPVSFASAYFSNSGQDTRREKGPRVHRPKSSSSYISSSSRALSAVRSPSRLTGCARATASSSARWCSSCLGRRDHSARSRLRLLSSPSCARNSRRLWGMGVKLGGSERRRGMSGGGRVPERVSSYTCRAEGLLWSS